MEFISGNAYAAQAAAEASTGVRQLQSELVKVYNILEKVYGELEEHKRVILHIAKYVPEALESLNTEQKETNDNA